MSPTAPLLVYEDELDSSMSFTGEEVNAANEEKSASDESTALNNGEAQTANDPTDNSPQTPAPTEKKRTRKRQRHPHLWKQNQRKEAVERGLKYTSKSGKEVPAKAMGGGCGLGCRNHCHMKIHPNQREKVFKEFWKLKHKEKWIFLRKFTEEETPKERRPGKSDREREITIKDFLPLNKDEKVKVCRTMFLSTFDISPQWVRTARSKDANSLVMDSPKTGKHPNHAQVDEEIKQSVRQHIESFPTVPSHLCRARSGRKYFEAGMNITKLWMLYLKHMQEASPGKKPASLRQYRDIFNNEFYIFFHHPKKDQCEICFIFQRLSEDARKKDQEKYDTHMRRKMEANALKESDKQAALANPDIVYACYDLQKVMNLPKSPVGRLYYLRKLNVYNFTIWAVHGRKKTRICFVWDETEYLRGAQQVLSAVYMFIEEMWRLYRVKEFRFWSDNCSGQNKNKFLYSMYTKAAATFGVKIQHRYMEKGHTYNEADSMHHTIEEATKFSDVYTPEQ